MQRYVFLLTGLLGAFNTGASTDVYPLPVPLSSLVMEVSEIAVVPDSTPGVVPRCTVMTEDPMGRLFVNDLRGPLFHVDEDSGSVTEYLDLRDYPELDLNAGFHGLQSFAFHPDFHKSGKPGFGRFYTLFSSNATEPDPDFTSGEGTSFHTLLLEWRTDSPADLTFVAANLANPYREVLRINQPLGGHVGGLIAFNCSVSSGHPDRGNLYIALGDGAQGGGEADPLENAENPANPYGAILRINPLGSNSANGEYGIVPENLFASDGDSGTLAEIFCYGLRNPQRFGWDVATGYLFIADIGHDALEEINLASNGANYGWDVREGSQELEGGTTTGLTDPVAEYGHVDFVTDPQPSISNRAITIGEVARGTCIDGLDGNLLTADFPTGIIFLLDLDSDPLVGGQDGFVEVLVREGGGSAMRMLDVINSARTARSLSTTSRADLRFSVNTPGRIYLINKQDGIIRRMQPNLEASHAISRGEANQVHIEFEGWLQRSDDLETWTDVIPQPFSPFIQTVSGNPVFFRSTCR
ncbi:MAG: sorbosone dehydrogenase family protein [Puniceicoccaceae bacterium]